VDTGRQLDVVEAGIGARATGLVYTSWIKPEALSGVLTSAGLHPTDGSKLNLRRSLPGRRKLSYLSSADSCQCKLLNFCQFFLEPTKIIRADESLCFSCSETTQIKFLTFHKLWHTFEGSILTTPYFFYYIDNT
jgi:hypothetical protein